MNIGLDVGYSAVKAVSGDRRVTFPSVVGTPEKARFSLDGAGKNDIILTQPGQVLVGEGAVLQSRHLKRREDRGWTESEEWYYLFLSAISELTSATQVDLRIVTGLPVSFYTDKDSVRETARRAQGSEGGAQCPNVEDDGPGSSPNAERHPLPGVILVGQPMATSVR